MKQSTRLLSAPTGLLVVALSSCGTASIPTAETVTDSQSLAKRVLDTPDDIGKLTGNFTVDLTPTVVAQLQAQNSLVFPPIVPALLPQPCENHISAPANNHAYIVFQQGTGQYRSVSWGMYMYKPYRPLYTFWKTRTTLNNTNLGELNKTYEPHGSIPASSLKVGHIVYIQGIAAGPNAYTYIQGACKVTN